MTSSTRSRVGDERAAKPAIALFAFRRLDLLKLTLSSLERAEGFSELSTYVYSDAGRREVPGEVEAVEAVREFLQRWCAERGAHLSRAEAHRGLRVSIVQGVSEVLRSHESIIVLEDDLLLSPHFLTFMRQALSECEHRTDIMQVSGYFVPHRSALPPVGLVRAPSSWGWATWRRAWDSYVDDARALARQVSALDKEAFDFDGTYAFYDALTRNAEGSLDTWAVRWYASMFIKGGYALHPSRSFVRNIGYRGDATNTGPSRTARVFLRQPIASALPSIQWNAIERGENPDFANAVEEFYRWQQAQWTKPTWRERLRARWNRLAGDDGLA